MIGEHHEAVDPCHRLPPALCQDIKSQCANPPGVWAVLAFTALDEPAQRWETNEAA